jgi:hypothetical protein
MRATSTVAIKITETADVGFESTLFGFVNDGFANSAAVLGQNLSLYF